VSAQKVKTPAEIEAMREGGKILATIFDGLKKQLAVGMSGRDVDAWVAKEIKALGATATYLEPSVNFPAVICVSPNDAVVHSVPTEEPFKQGDVVGFDLVITYKNMKTDSAFTAVFGDPPRGEKKRLLELTERAMYAGIDAIKGPTQTNDIGAAVEDVLKAGKLGILRELVGHGIGHEMHQAPDIPNYRTSRSVLLKPGDTVAVEPMAMLGDEAIYQDKDGWTIRTVDGSLSAHFEHTVLVTEGGCEILTKL
jgi:methionyl aminopeptidase